MVLYRTWLQPLICTFLSVAKFELDKYYSQTLSHQAIINKPPSYQAAVHVKLVEQVWESQPNIMHKQQNETLQPINPIARDQQSPIHHKWRVTETFLVSIQSRQTLIEEVWCKHISLTKIKLSGMLCQTSYNSTVKTFIDGSPIKILKI